MRTTEDVKISIGNADLAITRWMARYGITLLRVSLGIIFLWFGGLKSFPQMRPAQQLKAIA